MCVINREKDCRRLVLKTNNEFGDRDNTELTHPAATKKQFIYFIEINLISSESSFFEKYHFISFSVLLFWESFQLTFLISISKMKQISNGMKE